MILYVRSQIVYPRRRLHRNVYYVYDVDANHNIKFYMLARGSWTPTLAGVMGVLQPNQPCNMGTSALTWAWDKQQFPNHYGVETVAFVDAPFHSGVGHWYLTDWKNGNNLVTRAGVLEVSDLRFPETGSGEIILPEWTDGQQAKLDKLRLGIKKIRGGV